MKILISLLATMFLVGCGNNSMNTNNPSTNDAVNNRPALEMTNAPAITNNASTNLPAMTNQ